MRTILVALILLLSIGPFAPAHATLSEKAGNVAESAKGFANRNPTVTGAVTGAVACGIISGGFLSLPCALVGGLIGHWSGGDPTPPTEKKDAKR
jgi:hypothetical protein